MSLRLFVVSLFACALSIYGCGGSDGGGSSPEAGSSGSGGSAGAGGMAGQGGAAGTGGEEAGEGGAAGTAEAVVQPAVVALQDREDKVECLCRTCLARVKSLKSL